MSSNDQTPPQDLADRATVRKLLEGIDTIRKQKKPPNFARLENFMCRKHGFSHNSFKRKLESACEQNLIIKRQSKALKGTSDFQYTYENPSYLKQLKSRCIKITRNDQHLCQHVVSVIKEVSLPDQNSDGLTLDEIKLKFTTTFNLELDKGVDLLKELSQSLQEGVENGYLKKFGNRYNFLTSPKRKTSPVKTPNQVSKSKSVSTPHSSHKRNRDDFESDSSDEAMWTPKVHKGQDSTKKKGGVKSIKSSSLYSPGQAESLYQKNHPVTPEKLTTPSKSSQITPRTPIRIPRIGGRRKPISSSSSDDDDFETSQTNYRIASAKKQKRSPSQRSIRSISLSSESSKEQSPSVGGKKDEISMKEGKKSATEKKVEIFDSSSSSDDDCSVVLDKKKTSDTKPKVFDLEKEECSSDDDDVLIFEDFLDSRSNTSIVKCTESKDPERSKSEKSNVLKIQEATSKEKSKELSQEENRSRNVSYRTKVSSLGLEKSKTQEPLKETKFKESDDGMVLGISESDTDNNVVIYTSENDSADGGCETFSHENREDNNIVNNSKKTEKVRSIDNYSESETVVKESRVPTKYSRPPTPDLPSSMEKAECSRIEAAKAGKCKIKKHVIVEKNRDEREKNKTPIVLTTDVIKDSHGLTAYEQDLLNKAKQQLQKTREIKQEDDGDVIGTVIKMEVKNDSSQEDCKSPSRDSPVDSFNAFSQVDDVIMINSSDEDDILESIASNHGENLDENDSDYDDMPILSLIEQSNLDDQDDWKPVFSTKSPKYTFTTQKDSKNTSQVTAPTKDSSDSEESVVSYDEDMHFLTQRAPSDDKENDRDSDKITPHDEFLVSIEPVEKTVEMEAPESCVGPEEYDSEIEEVLETLEDNSEEAINDLLQHEEGVIDESHDEGEHEVSDKVNKEGPVSDEHLDKNGKITSAFEKKNSAMVSISSSKNKRLSHESDSKNSSIHSVISISDEEVKEINNEVCDTKDSESVSSVSESEFEEEIIEFSQDVNAMNEEEFKKYLEKKYMHSSQSSQSSTPPKKHNKKYDFDVSDDNDSDDKEVTIGEKDYITDPGKGKKEIETAMEMEDDQCDFEFDESDFEDPVPETIKRKGIFETMQSENIEMSSFVNMQNNLSEKRTIETDLICKEKDKPLPKASAISDPHKKDGKLSVPNVRKELVSPDENRRWSMTMTSGVKKPLISVLQTEKLPSIANKKSIIIKPQPLMSAKMRFEKQKFYKRRGWQSRYLTGAPLRKQCLETTADRENRESEERKNENKDVTKGKVGAYEENKVQRVKKGAISKPNPRVTRVSSPIARAKQQLLQRQKNMSIQPHSAKVSTKATVPQRFTSRHASLINSMSTSTSAKPQKRTATPPLIPGDEQSNENVNNDQSEKSLNPEPNKEKSQVDKWKESIASKHEKQRNPDMPLRLSELRVNEEKRSSATVDHAKKQTGASMSVENRAKTPDMIQKGDRGKKDNSNKKKVSFIEKPEVKMIPAVERNNSVKPNASSSGYVQPLPTTIAKKTYNEMEFLSRVLCWSVLWLDEQDASDSLPPINGKQILWPLIESYDSVDDYIQIMQGLLFTETWEQIRRSWKDIKMSGQQTVMKLAQIQVECIKPEFMIFKCQAIVQRNEFQNIFSEGDLVVMNQKRGKPGGPSEIAPVFGFVDKVTRTPINPRLHVHPLLGNQKTLLSQGVIVLTINIRTRIRKHPLLNDELLEFKLITSLIPTQRQYRALVNFPKSCIARDLLRPVGHHVFGHRAAANAVQVKGYYNSSQKQAIINCSDAVSQGYALPKICLLQGPPGTGKSLTIVGLIKQIVHGSPPINGKKTPKVLLCAPSNAAIDEMCKKLIAERRDIKNNKSAKTLNIVRVGRQQSVHPEVKQYLLDELVKSNVEGYKTSLTKSSMLASIQTEISNTENKMKLLKEKMQAPHTSMEDRKRLGKEISDLERKKRRLQGVNRNDTSKDIDELKIKTNLLLHADVVCTTLNGSGSNTMIDILRNSTKGVHFSCVIVDEAAQSIEVDNLVPLMYKSSKLILVGDPEQLPATVISKQAADNNYGQSLFDRLYNHFKLKENNPVQMLTIQYRMHPEICSFPSKHVYGGKLETDRLIAQRRSKFPLKHYLLFDVKFVQEEFSRQSSVCNPLEAEFVTRLCRFVQQQVTNAKTIGVITPYQGQKGIITRKLGERGLKDIEVGTVDGFQGRQKDVIVLSCVRAKSDSGTIGFLADRRRMNVALTRAKYALYVVGCLESLKVNTDWRALIDDGTKRGVITMVPSLQNVEDVFRTAKKDSTIRD